MGRKRQRRTVHFSPPDADLDLEYHDEHTFLQRLIQQLERSLTIARERLDRLRDNDSSIE